MADFYDALNDRHRAFIANQKMFFTASAPSAGGHVNLSPKGADTFRVLGENLCCYLDMTGSGNETAAHMRDNGRLTIMFCSFDRTAQIMRLFGTGRVAAAGSVDFMAHIDRFDDFPGIRQMIFLDIETVQTSCGYGVPVMDFVDHRETMAKWALSKGEDGLVAYRADKNMVSLDGLPTGFSEGAVK